MSVTGPNEQKQHTSGSGRDSISMNQTAGSTGSPAGSPTSSPRQRVKPGLLHSLKQKIFSGQHTTDPEYETARRQFMQLHDASIKIQIQAKNFLNNVTNTIHSAHFISDEFAALFNDGGAQHPYHAMIDAMNTGHDTLDSDAVLKAFVDQFNTTVLRRLTEELEHHRAVQTRMADRDQVKADVDYYKTKVDKLQGEHDKRLSSGKQEASKEIEKFTRNQEKFNNVKSDYNELNHTLVAELRRMWNERQQRLGPIVTDFVAMERQFVTMYNQAIQNIPAPDAESSHVNGTAPHERGLSNVPLNGVTSTTQHDQPIEIQAATEPTPPEHLPYQTQIVVTPDQSVYQQPIHHQQQPSTNGISDIILQQQQQHQQHVQETNYAQQQANAGPTEGHVVYAQQQASPATQHAHEMAQQQAVQAQQQAAQAHNRVDDIQQGVTSSLHDPIDRPVPTQQVNQYEHDGPDHSSTPTPGAAYISGLPAPIQYGESGARLSPQAAIAAH